MMRICDLPKQPSLAISYWNVGKLLYSALFLFIAETIYYFLQFQNAYQNENLVYKLFWLWCLLFSFSHIFLVLMDGWSRFQNYKRIKDHIFQHGFTPKIAAHYAGSKCQRIALMTAAKELGLEAEANRYYRKLGVKWYHFAPQFMVEDPLFLIKRYFWSRTFLEKYYTPKFDYRHLEKITA